MRHEIRHNPDFGVLRIGFDQPGEQIITESGAMVARDSAMEMKTSGATAPRVECVHRRSASNDLDFPVFSSTIG